MRRGRRLVQRVVDWLHACPALHRVYVCVVDESDAILLFPDCRCVVSMFTKTMVVTCRYLMREDVSHIHESIQE